MYGTLSKSLSLLLAIVLSTVILLAPNTVTNNDNSVNHNFLMLLLLGIMLGFIHGVGFKPISRLYRYLLSPIIAWLIMIPSLIILMNKIGVL